MGGIDRNVVIRGFNDSIINKEFYLANKNNPAKMSMFNPNYKLDTVTIEEIMHFCLMTDVYEKTGLGFKEFMNMDKLTFEIIKEEMGKHKSRLDTDPEIKKLLKK